MIARLRNESDPGWDRRGQIVVRLELTLAVDGPDRPLGTYEFLVGFTKDGETFRKSVTVTEGPFVALIQSDTPDRIVIALRTEPETAVIVEVRRVHETERSAIAVDRFESAPARKHEILLTGLEPDADYSYRIEAGGVEER